jgi:hypothetical protein
MQLFKINYLFKWIKRIIIYPYEIKFIINIRVNKIKN